MKGWGVQLDDGFFERAFGEASCLRTKIFYFIYNLILNFRFFMDNYFG